MCNLIVVYPKILRLCLIQSGPRFVRRIIRKGRFVGTGFPAYVADFRGREFRKRQVEKDRWREALGKAKPRSINQDWTGETDRWYIVGRAEQIFEERNKSVCADTPTTGNALHSVACCSGIHCGETEQWTARIAFLPSKNESRSPDYVRCPIDNDDIDTTGPKPLFPAPYKRVSGYTANWGGEGRREETYIQKHTYARVFLISSE